MSKQVVFAFAFLLVASFLIYRVSNSRAGAQSVRSLQTQNAQLRVAATALQVHADLNTWHRPATPNTHTQSTAPLKNEQPAPNAKATSTPMLGRVDSLILPEIPFEDPVDLQSEGLTSLKEFELYRTPSERWYERARQIVDSNRDTLAKSRDHVDDPGQRVTIVTALLDLGRDKLEKVGQFKRSFSEYIARFQRTINVNFPMVVFMDAKHVSELDLSKHTKGITIIPFSVDKLEKAYSRYFDRIEEIRGSALYKRQAQRTGWLQFAPQAALRDYNLLVMTKVFLLRWAAMLNPWRTQYHLFVDAGHDCVGALRDTHLDFFRRMMGRMMVSFFDYRTQLTSETHGMPQKAYRHYVGPPYNDPDKWRSDKCCKVVRGGIFGGTPAYIDVYARVYNELLSQTLSEGYMGTEENVMGALAYRFPELQNAYHNHDGDNCRLFVDGCEATEADTEIFRQPAVPLQWDSARKEFRQSSDPATSSPGKLRG